MKNSISIIISAHNEDKFIEECLDSIDNQTYFKDFNDYEILLSIDGCEKTLLKIEKIRNKYKNLRLFWFEENNGPYLVFNTLISKSKYDIICIFGADDIMLNDFVEYNIKYLNKKNIIRTKCLNFKHPLKDKNFVSIYNTDGVIFLYKENFLNINGYRNWRCGGDTDLRKRLHLKGVFTVDVSDYKFLRRLHNENLTISGEYKTGSEYRNNIQNIINKNTSPYIDKFEICEKVKQI